MKERPADFDEAVLADALARDWAMSPPELEYVPVGFGGHHWRAQATSGAFFITLSDVAQINDLRHAFGTAHWLEHTARLDFVLGPLRSTRGLVVEQLGDQFALSVYPWLDDVQPAHDPDGALTASLVRRLHSVELPRGSAPTEDFLLPRRAKLEAALGDLDRPWVGGPYGERARAATAGAGAGIACMLEEYDGLVATAPRAGWVITHGEPYGPNLLQGPDQRLYLVDWDSALWAPRERDLWELPQTEAAIAAYGVAGDAPAMQLYRLQYALAELALYIDLFHGPHPGDLNDAQSWQNLHLFLP